MCAFIPVMNVLWIATTHKSKIYNIKFTIVSFDRLLRPDPLSAVPTDLIPSDRSCDRDCPYRIPRPAILTPEIAAPAPGAFQALDGFVALGFLFLTEHGVPAFSVFGVRSS